MNSSLQYTSSVAADKAVLLLLLFFVVPAVAATATCITNVPVAFIIVAATRDYVVMMWSAMSELLKQRCRPS